MPLNPYDQDLDKNPANYQPLTPLSLLQRAAQVHPEHPAVIHGGRRPSTSCERVPAARSFRPHSFRDENER